MSSNRRYERRRSVLRYVVAAGIMALCLRAVLSMVGNPSPGHSTKATSSRSSAGRLQESGDLAEGNSPSDAMQPRLIEEADELDSDDEVERLPSPVRPSGLPNVGEGDSVVPTPIRTVLPQTTPTLQPTPSPSIERPVSTEDNDPDHLLQALQMASQPDAGASDFIGGVRSSTGGRSSGPPIPVTPTETPEADMLPWASGQARGYAMLYAMKPEARAVVEAQVRTLLEARVRQPLIAVLIDGTFGQDFAYLRDVISRLSTDGRRLTVVLYLSNGPTMRVWNETPIRALFSQIEPKSFRSRIMSDGTLRAQYRAVGVQARGLFEHNTASNTDNQNIAVVMLEDNLTFDVYRSMRTIAREALQGKAITIRNPCVGCYPGNDGNSGGDPVEEHSPKAFDRLGEGDGFSLDGTGFDYPDVQGSTGLSSQALLRMARGAQEKQLRYFALWQHAWQGAERDGRRNKHPSQRAYIPSNTQQREFEIKALREGLVVEEQGEG